MKDTLEFFDVYPKVLPVGRKTTVHIKPLSKHAAYTKEQYYVHVIPMDERARNVYEPTYDILTVKPENGCIEFDYVFSREEGYVLFVEDKKVTENKSGTWSGVRCDKFFLYAVQDDLLCLKPYRGNMHMHSFRSDGVEAPEIVAASYRKAGFDFMALTDHGLYEPSQEAIDAYKGVELNMHIFNGEEVHSPDNKIHIINFGGDYSVNNLYRADEPAYRKAVDEIEKTLTDVPEGSFTYEIAASKWVFDRIREANGLSILCHPNWTWYGAYNIPNQTYHYFMDHIDYDALELINGGNFPYENQLQVASWYNHSSPDKRPIPVGTDDSHGTINGKWFNIGKTYVLAKSLEREDLFGSIRKGLCGAVEQYHGEHAHIYGSERMVRYLTYLDYEYFPLHDALCEEEGRLMSAYVNGDETAAARLAACKGQIEKLAKHLIAE